MTIKNTCYFSQLGCENSRYFFVLSFWLKMVQSRTVSRVMSRMIICLILLSPADFSDPPKSNPGRIIAFDSVLLRVRFTWHFLLPENRWALTPPFHPYRPQPAVYLCCTVFGVASTGRYPAPCPMKPGLSSLAPFRDLQARPCIRLTYLCTIHVFLLAVKQYIVATHAMKCITFFFLLSGKHCSCYFTIVESIAFGTSHHFTLYGTPDGYLYTSTPSACPFK